MEKRKRLKLDAHYNGNSISLEITNEKDLSIAVDLLKSLLAKSILDEAPTFAKIKTHVPADFGIAGELGVTRATY